VHRSGNSARQLDAVVLAGGRASRLGGADKPALVVGRRSLVASVLSAVAEAGAQRVVVVGPERPGLEFAGELRAVREDPPGSGPVPALRRGLAEVSAPWVVVLAADLPFIAAEDLRSLLAAGQRAGPAAGAVLADDTGRPQWLAGCWQTGVLRAAAGGYAGGSLRGLLGPLAPVIVGPAPDQAGPPPWLDCDTEDDVRLARAWSGVPARGGPDVPR
jgi:molybdopterin-guanine dinucleotide biosynthesis protein A